MADGTVVRINKTVIADTSDDGNSFFFHSSTFHHPGFGKEYPDEEEEEIEHEFTDKKEDEDETVDDGDVELSTASSSSTTTFGLVPKIDDDEEAFNDVFADVDKNENNSDANKGVDDGLVTIEAIQK